MTREEAKKHLPLIQAFADGATIEFLDIMRGKWAVLDDPSFTLCTEYRIKPEPKVIWVKETFDAGHIYTEVSYKPVEDGFVKYMEVIE